MKPMKIVLAFVVLAAALVTVAHAQTQVFIPGNASGYFGNSVDTPVPFVPAVTVSGPATITVTYVSGTVNWGQPGVDVGPNGGAYANTGGFQFPLQEAKGTASPPKVNNIAALIGAFVPQWRVNAAGFSALDGTKNVARAGVMPNWLFFVGTDLTFSVPEAGTLYLGINDTLIDDNSGGFTVTLSAQ